MDRDEFVQASSFVRAYGRVLVDIVGAHVESIMSIPTGAPWLLKQWQGANSEDLRDLAALLAWIYTTMAYCDVLDFFPPESHKEMDDELYALRVNFFGMDARKAELCRKYNDCAFNGHHLLLGGGLIEQGGTYLFDADDALGPTHLWMINEALHGPELNVVNGCISAAELGYLQLATSTIMEETTNMFFSRARTLFRNLS